MNIYSYVHDPTGWVDPLGWYFDLKHDGMGHHLFPRSVAKKLKLKKLQEVKSIAWYPNDPKEYSRLTQALAPGPH